ncbi:hypothetical protein HCH_03625 [Hahella chejuensis KCTC 2396]|uniref:Uncharacterized protein n=1 Tax=Hahella chejuensis (strain KCTC 2396) TaxID=349521 RepID=Q2SG58_HAHCH|nr:hypothetical protein HCH_03625 [Hahella chejuensis KCTC 2396]
MTLVDWDGFQGSKIVLTAGKGEVSTFTKSSEREALKKNI